MAVSKGRAALLETHLRAHGRELGPFAQRFSKAADKSVNISSFFKERWQTRGSSGQ